MKCTLFFIALLGIAAFASPVPSSYEYDPDCVENESEDTEPAPEIDLVKPAHDEPSIKIEIDEAPEEEDCEDPVTTDEPATPAPTTAEVKAPTAGTEECVDATTEGPVATVDPCEADPCAAGCDAPCDVCAHLDKCQVDPCAADPCGEGCAQPCDVCAHLDKCQTDENVTPTCEADTEAPTAAPETSGAPETTKAPETDEECEDDVDVDENAPIITEDFAYVEPSLKITRDGETEGIEECIE